MVPRICFIMKAHKRVCWAIKMLMARTGMAAQGSGGEPVGRKHHGEPQVSGGPASQRTTQDSRLKTQDCDDAPRCDLCNLLRASQRQRNRPPCPPLTQDSGRETQDFLRCALVDHDAGTRATAGEMVQQRRVGWTLVVYTPPERGHSCPRTLPTQGFGLKTQDSIRPYPPDVVLIALRGSGLSGLGCVRRLKALVPGLPVVVISERCDGAAIGQCCMAGADGCLTKPIAPEDLAWAVSEAAQGVRVLCGRAQGGAIEYIRHIAEARPARTAASPLALALGAKSPPTGAGSCRLNAREELILACLEEGLLYKEITDRLHISYSLMRKLQRRIFKKLHAANGAEAIQRWHTRGLEPIGD